MPDVDVLAPNAAVLAANPALIGAAHDAGLEVHTWTVDDPAQMQTLIDAGIDGYFTNDPATARGIVDEAERGSGREAMGDVDQDAPSAIDACPEGMGVGLSAAADESATTTEPPVTDDSGDADGLRLVLRSCAGDGLETAGSQGGDQERRCQSWAHHCRFRSRGAISEDLGGCGSAVASPTRS